MPPRPMLRPGLLSRSGGMSFSLPIRSRSYATDPFQQMEDRLEQSELANNRVTAGLLTRTPLEPWRHNRRSTDQLSTVTPKVPPESPRFVQYPKPPQSEDVERVRIKGHMPVPRDVFKPRLYKAGRRKAIAHRWAKKSDPEAFVASATPLSKAELAGEEPKNQREADHRAHAALQRKILLEGLKGLWERKVVVQKKKAERSFNLSNRNRRAALAPPKRDELLTSSDVRSVTAINTAVIRDPLRHEKQAASAARSAAFAQAKKEQRRDGLMQLYQAAGKFIVDEKELEERVNELFREDYFKEEGYSYGTVNAENIWDVVGKPASVQDLLDGIQRTESRLFDAKRTELDRTAKRQKLVAEALTGGKMPV